MTRSKIKIAPDSLSRNAYHISCGARAADIDEAIQAYLAGDYNQAFNLFEPFAEEGNTLAQYSLATVYDPGQGVKEDQQAAAHGLPGSGQSVCKRSGATARRERSSRRILCGIIHFAGALSECGALRKICTALCWCKLPERMFPPRLR